MVSHCLALSITKKGHFLLQDNNHSQPFQYKVFIKLFQYVLKSLETLLIRNYFYSNAKNYKYQKIIDLRTDSLIEIY